MPVKVNVEAWCVVIQAVSKCTKDLAIHLTVAKIYNNYQLPSYAGLFVQLQKKVLLHKGFVLVIHIFKTGYFSAAILVPKIQNLFDIVINPAIGEISTERWHTCCFSGDYRMED